MAEPALPLAGIRVLDFSTLLPGPLATLMLAEAGASVVKIEAKAGDGARANTPRDGDESLHFALLNRGKKSVVLDLKSPEGKAAALRLAGEADVLVDQFRPGVMKRLGLDYEAVRAVNPKIIYCSISGYGQTGPLATAPGHDINYMARAGMLALGRGEDGHPVFPAAAVADIGGGTLPAVINILLALLRRNQTGTGCHLDIAMTENTLAWMPRALGAATLGQPMPLASEGRHLGGRPRYGLYITADGKALAVAALEPHFWERFCDLIGLPAGERDDSSDPHKVRSAVAAAIAAHDCAWWMERFRGEDVCVDVVQDLSAAMHDPHFNARGVWDRKLHLHNGRTIAALPLPLSPELSARGTRAYPALGSHAADDAELWKND